MESVSLHMIIEQTKEYPMRMIYHSDTGEFHASEYASLALEEKFLHKGIRQNHIAGLAHSLRKKSLVSLIDVTARAQKMLSQNCNMNLLATWYCAQIRQSRH